MSRRDSSEYPHDDGPPRPRKPHISRRDKAQPTSRKEINGDPDEEPQDDPLIRTEAESTHVQIRRLSAITVVLVALITGWVILKVSGESADSFTPWITVLIASLSSLGACRLGGRRRR